MSARSIATAGVTARTQVIAAMTIAHLVQKVWGYCEASDIRAKTVTVKIKYADFKQATRSRSQQIPFGSEQEISDTCKVILAGEFPVLKGVRLLGATLSSLNNIEPEKDKQFMMKLI